MFLAMYTFTVLSVVYNSSNICFIGLVFATKTTQDGLFHTTAQWIFEIL